MSKKPNKSNRLDKRLEFIENLHNRFKITDRMLDVLDAVARVEAGALSFEDILKEYTR